MAVPGVITKKECYAYISSTTIQTQLIFFNEAKEELIFPVNNMCLENRTVLTLLGIRKQSLKKKFQFIAMFWNPMSKRKVIKRVMLLYKELTVKR